MNVSVDALKFQVTSDNNTTEASPDEFHNLESSSEEVVREATGKVFIAVEF